MIKETIVSVASSVVVGSIAAVIVVHELKKNKAINNILEANERLERENQLLMKDVAYANKQLDTLVDIFRTAVDIQTEEGDEDDGESD